MPQNILELLAKVVAAADEIRHQLSASGDEAAQQFEQAVQRNRVSFADLLGRSGEEPR